jgi:hypothetical protein
MRSDRLRSRLGRIHDQEDVMPVLSMLRMQGDPDELWARLQEYVEPVAERLAAGHGGLLNVVARTSDGIVIVNLWEHEQGRHDMAAEPEMQAAFQSSGLPQPHFDGFEVMRLRTSEQLAARAET